MSESLYGLTMEQQHRIRKQYEHSYRPMFEKFYSEAFPNDKCTMIATGNYSGWIKQRAWGDFKYTVVYTLCPDFESFQSGLSALKKEVSNGSI